MVTSTPPDTAARPSALPTALTIARLVAAPLTAGFILWGDHVLFTAGGEYAALLIGAALLIFILAALTDWADGALARRLNAVTPLGAALDHAADKALVTATLVALAATFLPFDLVIAAGLILTRDVAVAGLREGLALSGRKLPVSGLGKLKTVLELVGVGAAIALQLAALLAPASEQPLEVLNLIGMLSRFSLWAAAALALWSGAVYARDALRPA